MKSRPWQLPVCAVQLPADGRPWAVVSGEQSENGLSNREAGGNDTCRQIKTLSVGALVCGPLLTPGDRQVRGRGGERRVEEEGLALALGRGPMATTPARPPTPFALSSSSLPGSPSLEGSCVLPAKVPWEEVREKLGAGTWAAGKELSAV